MLRHVVLMSYRVTYLALLAVVLLGAHFVASFLSRQVGPKASLGGKHTRLLNSPKPSRVYFSTLSTPTHLGGNTCAGAFIRGFSASLVIVPVQP